MYAQWKKDEATMKQEFEDKLEHLREEKTHINEEFMKIRHKAKVRSSGLLSTELLLDARLRFMVVVWVSQDIETHVNEKWKKKIARIQADMTKVKTQMDELNLKNVAFREKLSNASSLKEQVRARR